MSSTGVTFACRRRHHPAKPDCTEEASGESVEEDIRSPVRPGPLLLAAEDLLALRLELVERRVRSVRGRRLAGSSRTVSFSFLRGRSYAARTGSRHRLGGGARARHEPNEAQA